MADDSLRVLMAIRRPYEVHGGVERVVRDVTAELRRQETGWTVTPVPAFTGAHRIEGLDGLSDVIAALRLGWRVARTPADVVFVHCPECVWGVRLFRRLRRTPIVVVWHGAGPKPYLVLRNAGNLLARALAFFRTTEERRALVADHQIAVHEEVRRDLRAIYDFQGPVTVIENAIDPETMRRLADVASGPAPERPFTLVWAGQAGHRKGLDVALAAVAEARRQSADVRLVVAGVTPGPAQPGVTWLGVVGPDEMPSVYHQADALLFPTRYESFGLVVVEAMAAGLPVIISDSVPQGIVEDGVNGYIIRGHDPSDYVRPIVSLANDLELRRGIGDANRIEAKRFSLEVAARRYAAVAREVVSGAPADPRST